MKIGRDKKWQWALGGIIMALIAAGCAGMNTAGDSGGPSDQGASTAMEELPTSAVTVEVEAEPEPEPEPEPEDFIHTVGLEGETLSLIAKWYTGNLSNWEALAEANPGIDPNRIFMGDEILIPEELLITDDPMPKSFIDEAYSKKKPGS